MEQYQVTGQDLFNSIAQGYNSNAVMQYVMRLEGKINGELLQKAVEFTLLQEPVLGCRLKKDSEKLVWEPLDSEDVFCQIVVRENLKDAVRKFLEQELDPETGAQIFVCLVCGKEKDTLCVKVSHAACDGCGSKYYIRILAETYTRLSQNANAQPKISIQERSTKPLYANLGITDKEEFFQPQLAELISTWGMPADSTERLQFQHKLLSFPPSEFEALHQYARTHHTTINSVITAAYDASLLQTMRVSSKEAKKEIQVMVDLRKYLPAGTQQFICNLSSAVNLELPVQYQSDFEKLIPLVTNEMKRIKERKTFLHGAVGVDLMAETGYHAIRDSYVSEWEQIKDTGKCTPMLSNLGILSTEPIYFGEVPVYEVDYVSPAFYAPAVMMGICTYCSRLTLCISYYTPEISRQRIQEILCGVGRCLKSLIHSDETN